MDSSGKGIKMEYLTDQEVDVLINKIKTGNNDAWEKICRNFDGYIHKCCRKRLERFVISEVKRKDLEEDMYMAGWQGFVNSLKNYNPEKAKFLTFATYYIDGEISKELDFLLNPLGLTERPKPKKSSEPALNNSPVISRKLSKSPFFSFVPKP